MLKKILKDFQKREKEADRLSRDKIKFAQKGESLRKLLAGKQIPFLNAIITDIEKLESKKHKLLKFLEKYKVQKNKKDNISKMMELVKQLKPEIEEAKELAEKQVKAIDMNDHTSLQGLFQEENSLQGRIGSMINDFQKKHAIEITKDFSDKSLEHELAVVSGNYNPFRRVIAFASMAIITGLLSMNVARDAYAGSMGEYYDVKVPEGNVRVLKRIEPSDVIPKQSLGYGKVLLDKDRIDKAIFEFRKVYVLHPTHELADDALAMNIQALAKDYKISEDRRAVTAMENLSLMLEGKYPGSPYIKEAKRLIAEAKNPPKPIEPPKPTPVMDSNYYVEQGRAALKAKNYHDAEKFYKQAIEKDLHNKGGYYGLSDVYKKLRPLPPLNEAIRLFEQGKKFNPNKARIFDIMIKNMKNRY